MICILDNNLNTLGVLESNAPEGTPFFNDKFHISDDGTQELEFSMPYNAPISDYMQGEGFLMYKAADGTMYLLRIVTIDESTLDSERVKVIKAENSAIGDLSRCLMRPRNYYDGSLSLEYGYNLKDYVTYCLQNTGWSVGVIQVYDGATSYVMNMDSYSNVYAKLQDGFSQWNCSPEFVVQMEGFKVISKQLNLYSKRVQDTTEVFTYGVDLIGVKRTVMSDQIINAVCPIGKGMANQASIRFDLTNTPVPAVPTQYASDFVIHPTYQDILYSKSAFQRYGRGQLMVGLLELPDCTDSKDLMNKACIELASKSKPQMQYEIKISTIQEWTSYQEDKKVNLGDTIIVLDDSFNPPIRVQARCIEKFSSWTTSEGNYCNFGDYKEIGQEPKVTFKKQTNLVNNNSAMWSDSSSRVQSGNINADDGSGLSMNNLNFTYLDTDGTTKKLLSVDTTQATPTVKINSLNTNVLASNANGAVITADVTQTKGYNIDTDEIEVYTADELKDAISQLPSYLYRRTVIRYKADITGNFYITGFWGEGELVISHDGFSLFGSYVFIRNSCRIGLSASSGLINGTACEDVIGNYTMYGMVNIINCSEVTLYGNTIYGNNSANGLYIFNSNVIGTNLKIFNCLTPIKADMSRLSMNNCVGLAKGVGAYGVDLTNASTYGGDGTCPQGQAGTTLALAIRLRQGSTNSSAQTPTAGTATSVIVQPITKRFNPSAPTGYSGSRAWNTLDNMWRLDNTYVYTGNWSAPSRNIGLWMFQDNILNTIRTKTVSSMRIYLTRTSDAGLSSVTVYITAHNVSSYSTLPTSSPEANFFRTVNGEIVVAATFALGQSKWVDVTSLAKYFNTGSNNYTYPAKGFGLLTTATDQAHYAKFSGDCIVEVTYK